MGYLFGSTLDWVCLSDIVSNSWGYALSLWGEIVDLWSRFLNSLFDIVASFLLYSFVFGYFFSLAFGGGGSAESNRQYRHIKSNDVDFNGPLDD